MSDAENVRMFQAAAEGADVTDDNDEEWDFKGAIGLKEVKRVGAQRRLHESQDSCHFKTHKFSKTVAEVL